MREGVESIIFVGWLLVAACCLEPSSALSQVPVRGTVLDAQTGDPLISATIQIKGTSRGTVSVGGGTFRLMVLDFPATLLVRHIGYDSLELTIDSAPQARLEIQLHPSTVVLDEVVIGAENPALPIVREALKVKHKMLDDVHSMYMDTYTRFLLYSDFSVVQMRESVRSTWWSAVNGPKEIVRAERVTPPGSGTFRFASAHYVVNLLDDLVPLHGSQYFGPLHPDALDIYKYTLGERRVQDGRTVFDIYFVPESVSTSAFTGRMSIADSTWYVQEINARPHPSTVVTPPVQEHSYFLDQRFVVLGDTLTVPLNLVINGVVRFGQPGATYPMARYEQLSSMSLHVVNSGIPDSLSGSQRRRFRHPLADRQAHLFNRNPSLIPMTPREMEDVAGLSPSTSVEQSFRPQGMLSAYTAVDVTEEQQSKKADGPLSGELRSLDRITSGDWFWYNRVDGWHPGIGWGSPESSRIRWRTNLGYSRERDRLSYRTGFAIPWTGGWYRGLVGGSFEDATAVVARSDDLGRFVPGMLTYLGYDDFYDYYHRRAGTVYVQLGRAPDKARLRVSGNIEKHATVEKNTDFDGWLFENEQRENPPISPGHLRTIETTLAIGRTEVSTASISVERTLDGVFDSDYVYTRVEARGTFRAATFFAERARPNRLRVTVLAGTKFGDLPIQRQYTIEGSAGPLSDYSGFRTLANDRFISERLFGVFWSHDFTTVPFELAGLWWLADRGMGVHIFGGHAHTYDEAYTSRTTGEYHELGVGITYPFGFPVRMDIGFDLQGGSMALRFGKPLK